MKPATGRATPVRPPSRAVPRVLYLGGLGRSGTTLIERLLGGLPGVTPLGEVVHLWERGLVFDELCGCGEPFRGCPFWRKVGDIAFGGWDTLTANDILERKSSIDRTRYIPLLTTRPPARLGRYLDLYRRVYNAVHNVTGCEVIVDSSKHASLAFCLRWADDLELRVAHVVRDSRAVAHSWTKRVPRPDRDGSFMATLPPWATAGHWVAQNTGFEVLAGCGVPTLRVRYEAFVDDPIGGLFEIAEFAGLETAPSACAQLLDEQAEPAHTVSGNPIRFASGRMTLRRDDAWRSGLPLHHRLLVQALTFPLLTRYQRSGSTS